MTVLVGHTSMVQLEDSLRLFQVRQWFEVQVRCQEVTSTVNGIAPASLILTAEDISSPCFIHSSLLPESQLLVPLTGSLCSNNP